PGGADRQGPAQLLAAGRSGGGSGGHQREHRKDADAAALSPQEAHQAGLLARAEADDRYYDRFRDRLMFPILSIQNEVLGFGGRTLGDSPAKYINTPETPIFRKRHNLYALNLAAPAIREQDHAIVVEGYMDVISLHQYGFHNSVATMGTALTPQVLSLLRRYTRTLFLAFDADSAGMNAILRSSALFRQQEVVVRVVKIPQGMDPDECVRRRGAEAFKELLHDSLSVLDYKVEQFLNSEVGSHPTSRALREAMQILAEADDPLQREEVMQRMALRWTGGDGERVIPLMEALRQTWRRWQRRAMNVAVNADNAEHTDPIAQTLMQRSQSEIPLGVERAERELIAAMMQDEVVARTVLEQMTPNEFLLPLHQQLAQMVAACLDADEFDKLPEYVSEAPDEQLKAKASGLLVADLNFLSAKNALETRIQTIRRYKLKKQLRARRNELLKMASNGRIDPRAPEVQELLELERKLRGKVTATTSS
ncbi:MAG TPA: toprim domain-containing protein, partial [Armatimonadetes bacterium]|nr:toprim domain-containing protein [Armatimonadota bacterium]